MVKKEKKSWLTIILVVLVLAFFSFLIAGFISLFFVSEDLSKGNVAFIEIKGPIMVDSSGGYFDTSETSSTEVLRYIESANEDDTIKAIVFDINSPGGSAVASSEIANAIKDSNKTTVALVRELGASGAFWIATSADYVFANELSLTGSIGVISSYLQFSGLLDKYNVTYERLVAGENKDLGSPFMELSEEGRDLFQEKLDYIHGVFIKEVAENRGLSEDNVREVADGFIMLGVEAKDLGFVDELGSEKDVIKYIETELNITVEKVVFKEKEGFLDKLMGISYGKSFFVGKGIGSVLFERDFGINV